MLAEKATVFDEKRMFPGFACNFFSTYNFSLLAGLC